MQNFATFKAREQNLPPLSPDDKKKIEKKFSKHINKGQLRYLKAGHLDVIETERDLISFIDPVSGKEMIDCFSSAGCFNVGRNNPVIIKAIDEALETLDMGTSCFISPQKIKLAEKLVEIAPGDLEYVLFASGGGEAVDCALKMAKAATGRSEILSTVKAYHGHTGFAISANGKEHYKRYFEPLIPGIKFVEFNDLEAAKKAVSKKTAAIIIEPVQGEAGIFPGEKAYLEGLRTLCDELGIILIFDEVQTGFGRTGRFFATEHSNVIPDILVLAKSIGGGIFPNGAVLYGNNKQLTDFIEKNPDFHPTYSGGSDIGCHVSLRVIDFLIENNIPENAAKRGARLKNALEDLQRKNPKIIKEVRGIGMMVGMEYIHEFLGPMMSDALAQNGVFAVYSGNAPQVMRFMLPIVATENDVERVIEAIEKSVKTMKLLLPVAIPAAKIPWLLKLLNSEKVQTNLFNWIRSVEEFIKKIKF